jgi:hypothetical protein
MRSTFLAIILLFSQVTYSEIKTAEVDGYTIEYEIIGSGDEVILLEAGVDGGFADWGAIPNSLSESGTVVRYSRVGNGNVSKPESLF